MSCRGNKAKVRADMSCHGMNVGSSGDCDAVVALVGNANVGKSAIFNQLTGLEQTVGNWPGKTVERAEGLLFHNGVRLRMVDLPGTYSLSTGTAEESVAQEYLLSGAADIVINVIDATALERNLFLTLQLIETGIPVVAVLNLTDAARQRGIRIDVRKLGMLLGIPVVETVAVHGRGIHELIDEAIRLLKKGTRSRRTVRYGPEVERAVTGLEALMRRGKRSRWKALRLLEGDAGLSRRMRQKHPDVVERASALSLELGDHHGEPASTVLASERYAVAGRVAREVMHVSSAINGRGAEMLDRLSLHPVLGYVLMIVVMLAILAFISILGGWIAQGIERAFESANPRMDGFGPGLLWNGAVVGLYSALGVAFGFLLPFYLILSALENSGYLPRIAFLMDRPCHLMGLHGKASVPFIVAFGCNVPACVGCRIIETKRDRLIATFLSTLIPCSARTIVILGIVGTYMGPLWAISIYIIDFLLILAIGRILNATVKGRSVGIIMEVPPFRKPVPRLLARQAWARFRPFLVMAVPLIVLGSTVIEGLRLAHAMDELTLWMSPMTVGWLGLPAFTGVLFLLGILRKEAALVFLAAVAGTVDIAAAMSPVQMFVFALVMTIYIPCTATIAALAREVGWKNTAIITFSEIGLALLVGGITYRALLPFI